MAVDTGIEILVDSDESADKKSEVLRRVLQVLDRYTCTITYAATYSAGSTSKNLVSIEVGGTGEDYGIRVIMDDAVITDYPTVLANLIKCLENETLTLTANATAYTAGDRAYNVSITLS